MTFRRTPPREPRQYTGKGPDMRPAACRMADPTARMSVPVPKDRPWRSETYRRAVANLPCAHCGKVGFSQCAHADTHPDGAKGMGIKVCDRLTYPACCAVNGYEGCHSLLASGVFKRWQRQILETRYVAETQTTLAHLLPASEETE